jgi:hypothetical protein
MIETISKTDMMTSVEIRNEELLEILNGSLDFFKTVPFDMGHNTSQKDVERREEYCSDEYFNHIKKMWNAHDGFPEMLCGVAFEGGGPPNIKSETPNIAELMGNYQDIAYRINEWAGAKRNALFAVYPPGGYISWHNNANCAAYNVLFTWSEEGKGRWKHWDPKKKEIVVIEDKPGWQCKMGYYGCYESSADGREIVYHMAETECLRATVAFIFNVDETGKKMAEMLLEEIQTP